MVDRRRIEIEEAAAGRRRPDPPVCIPIDGKTRDSCNSGRGPVFPPFSALSKLIARTICFETLRVAIDAKHNYNCWYINESVFITWRRALYFMRSNLLLLLDYWCF